MLKQALIVFGVLLAFGCSDVQRTDRQFDFDSGGCGCNECPDGLSEGKADSGDSSDAEWQGSKQIGSTAIDVGYGISIDSLGNVYVAGFSTGNFDGHTNAGGTDIFLLKYNSSGVKQWSRHIGSSFDDHAYGIAVDQSDNIYIAGDTDKGSLDGNPNAGSNDAFIAKYNSSGSQQWIKQFGTSGGDKGYDIAAGASGDVYVSGSTGGALFGESHTGSFDAFVVKFDSNGNQKWTWQLGTSLGDVAHDLVTDSANNVYVSIESSRNFDGNANSGGGDLYLVKLNNNGIKQWSRGLGSSANDYAWNIAGDNSGNIYITGATSGDLDGNSNLGGNDLILVKYDSNGTKQWTKQVGTNKDDTGSGIFIDNLGNVYVSGSTWGTMGGTANQGYGDVLTMKFNSAGDVQWAKQIGSTHYDDGLSISGDVSGNLFVTGFAKAGLDGNSGVGLEDVFVLKYDSAGNIK